MMIVLTAGILISCNSPMSVDTPREETPIGKVNAYLSEFSLEQYGKVSTFKADEYNFFINLYSNPNMLWADIVLDAYSNPVDEVLRIALKKISIHLDSVKLVDGNYVIPEDTYNFIDFEFFRWENPDVLETKFETTTNTTSVMNYKIDKIRKVITLNFDININDVTNRIEAKSDGFGGVIYFESSESKTIPVKLTLMLKYI